MKENSDIPEIFLKPYDPKEHEEKLYAMWEESGFFNPDVCVKKGITDKDAEPYSIVLPPPNVTGTLHMGHAAMLAVEDILIRYNRMCGKKTLWLPGTDSAAIATQSKVEFEIYKKDKETRHDIGREKLLKRINTFTEESKSTILNQLKKMGSSLDWSRYAYTMDEERYNAVMEAFIRMYEAGLVERGNRIVNWDPNLQTTVSDDEIEYVVRTDPFYYLQYGPFVIGTVRPETKFGDKYVVMHPDDDRYRKYEHKQEIELEWINGPITATIIKDEAVDMDMGSGVMTITPAHSAIDFEIATRHGLDVEQVIDERGILLPIAGEFEGQHIKKARGAIVEKLQKKGLVTKVDEKYVHNVATNSRGEGIIEPQIKQQWFVMVNKPFQSPKGEMTLKELMKQAVKSGEVNIMPERFEKTYYHWIENLRDWCISRQIWFGHRIPAWYCLKETVERGGTHREKMDSIKDWKGALKFSEPAYVGHTPPKICPECGGNDLVQDPDVLDTWFSSGLWTFSTLGWPKETDDLKTYHPTSVLETGYDILFFWVARMILMSGFFLGDVPFKQVYLHGLVRDEQGRKMSKSLGNIIDPLDMVEKYGADATRTSLIVGAAPGSDIKLSEDTVRAYKHFANKLWNISRFVLSYHHLTKDISNSLNKTDKEIVEETKQKVREVENQINKFRLDMALGILYPFAWNRFASEIIEESKSILNGSDVDAAKSRALALNESLSIILKLLHPFMPYVTEAIWQELPKEMKDAEMLMVAKWPH